MVDLGSKHRLIDEMPGNGGGTAAASRPTSVRDPSPPLSTAELAECTCPEFCARDHETD